MLAGTAALAARASSLKHGTKAGHGRGGNDSKWSTDEKAVRKNYVPERSRRFVTVGLAGPLLVAKTRDTATVTEGGVSIQ